VIEIIDMPKLSCPYERETINKTYQVVPKLKPEFEWIFTDDCLAVDKLDGTNVSVVVGDNQIKNIYNRTARINIWKSKDWFYNGVRHSIESKNFNPDFLNDGQYFGELIGPKIQGNPYQLEKPRWVPLAYLQKKYHYKFWNGVVLKETKDMNEQDKFNYVSDTFKGLWSLYKRQRGIKGEVDEATDFSGLAAEGIVFTNIKTGDMCKLRRDMFSWFKGRRHVQKEEEMKE